ncbi:hypothetical protein SKAU_G00024140 [Synaphobranchus kaupii]|uniref:Uncharacterized protein n=1 Tax=Synaphobranchus kaupii TaxID=118154 RepID=A0A9Q1GDP0_SYNKA|nr:hypothetical protein SKAU_G00024140 [Synaphobranchus kaupii]
MPPFTALPLEEDSLGLVAARRPDHWYRPSSPSALPADYTHKTPRGGDREKDNVSMTPLNPLIPAQQRKKEKKGRERPKSFVIQLIIWSNLHDQHGISPVRQY